MVIETQKVGILSYQIKVDQPDGEILETVTTDNPRTMLFGTGRVLAGFEKRLLGLKSGDTFDFVMEPDEAFGDFREELLMEVPKTAFIVNGELKAETLKIGRTVPMMDGEGNPFEGRIIEIVDDAVRMDFNHPLAGKTLRTSGVVINVREATDEELNPAPSGCGCGTQDSSCCGGGGHEHSHDEHGCGCGTSDESCCSSSPELQEQSAGSCGCH
ncbi:MAG: peptidylprolyl isomerase [Bacteroidales bacterium]|jgi:FKBP-type peptidyl-prolyl cis-trans isomerase SlyD|nr:peptidylprolyl isomerase [Bacteroidales bacterium]